MYGKRRGRGRSRYGRRGNRSRGKRGGKRIPRYGVSRGGIRL